MDQPSVSVDELVEAFRLDFPREYEITGLRLVNAAQARRIAELEAQLSAPDQP